MKHGLHMEINGIFYMMLEMCTSCFSPSRVKLYMLRFQWPATLKVTFHSQNKFVFSSFHQSFLPSFIHSFFCSLFISFWHCILRLYLNSFCWNLFHHLLYFIHFKTFYGTQVPPGIISSSTRLLSAFGL